MRRIRNMPMMQRVRLNAPQDENDDVQMAPVQNHVPFRATILPLPRTRYVLWPESEIGVGVANNEHFHLDPVVYQ